MSQKKLSIGIYTFSIIFYNTYMCAAAAVLVFAFQDKVLLCNLGWFRTHDVDLTGLKHAVILLPQLA